MMGDTGNPRRSASQAAPVEAKRPDGENLRANLRSTARVQLPLPPTEKRKADQEAPDPPFEGHFRRGLVDLRSPRRVSRRLVVDRSFERAARRRRSGYDPDPRTSSGRLHTDANDSHAVIDRGGGSAPSARSEERPESNPADRVGTRPVDRARVAMALLDGSLDRRPSGHAAPWLPRAREVIGGNIGSGEGSRVSTRFPERAPRNASTACSLTESDRLRVSRHSSSRIRGPRVRAIRWDQPLPLRAFASVIAPKDEPPALAEMVDSGPSR